MLAIKVFLFNYFKEQRSIITEKYGAYYNVKDWKSWQSNGCGDIYVCVGAVWIFKLWKVLIHRTGINWMSIIFQASCCIPFKKTLFTSKSHNQFET